MDKKIGVLVSGGGTNLQAIIAAWEAGKSNGRVVAVGSDNPEAYGLARAEKHKIPTFTVDYKKHRERYMLHGSSYLPDDFYCNDYLTKGGDMRKEWKTAAEKELLEKLAEYRIDLLVLAGFMQLFTPYFIDRWNMAGGEWQWRIMNIHPALLPAFPGTDGYGDTFNYGCKIGGCTVHYVDYGEDTGPIIGQAAYQIFPRDTLDEIKKRGLKLEHELYPVCIQYHALGWLRVVENEMNRRVVLIEPK